MAWESQERRRFSRAIFPCRIVVDSSLRSLVSHTENIGEGGVRIFLEEKLEPLTVVGLELYLEKDKPVRCKGRVVWVQDKINPINKQPLLFDTGIEFTQIDNLNRQYIKNLIDTILVQEKK